MHASDTFWPDKEEREETRYVHLNRSLCEAVVKHLAPAQVAEWRRNDWFMPAELILQLGLGNYLLASGLSVDWQSLVALLKTPTKSPVFKEYERLQGNVLPEFEHLGLAMAVRWPGWCEHAIFHPAVTDCVRQTGIVVAVRGRMYVVLPLKDWLGA